MTRIVLSVGDVYRKIRPATSGRTKPENRGEHSIVRITALRSGGGAGLSVSLRVIEGPLLFSSRMTADRFLSQFERVGREGG